MFGFAAFAQTPLASLSGNAFALSLAENINMVDTSTQVSVFNSNISENTNLLSFNIPSGEFYDSVNEFLTSSNTQTISAQFASSLTENSILENVQVGGIQFTDSNIENFSLADTTTQYFAMTGFGIEPIVADDDNNIQANFVGQLYENFNPSTIYAVTANFNTSIEEIVYMLDNLCYNGWFKIDDSQAALWGNITTPVDVWSNINTNQTAGWAAIPSSMAVGWNTINTINIPNWGTIDTKQPCS